MAQDPQALLRDADTAASKKGFLGWGSTPRDEVAEMYRAAATSFRAKNLLKESGTTFEKAALMYHKKYEQDMRNNDDKDKALAKTWLMDEASSLTEASKVYSVDHPLDAARVLEATIPLYEEDVNGLRRAAKAAVTCGTLYDTRLQDFKRASDFFEKAGRLYEVDGAPASAKDPLLNAARITAQHLADFPKAIGLYEKVTAIAVGNPALRFSLKIYFLQSGICHLAAGDMVATKRAIDKYKNMDVSFSSTQEAGFLDSIVTAVEAGDQEAFEDACYQWKLRNKEMDPWMTQLLLVVKKGIIEIGDDFS